MSEQLILVDKDDNEIGSEEKDKAHRGSLPLHRAFSVFIFNIKGELLIHKRSGKKKTWPGFWTNTCCSHPRVGEATEEAAKRRLEEEMGFSCPLKFLFKFTYKARYDDVYGEHEVDNVFSGRYDGPVKPDRNEVDEWKFVGVGGLRSDMKKNPEKYTPWFRLCLERVLQ